MRTVVKYSTFSLLILTMSACSFMREPYYTDSQRNGMYDVYYAQLSRLGELKDNLMRAASREQRLMNELARVRKDKQYFKKAIGEIEEQISLSSQYHQGREQRRDSTDEFNVMGGVSRHGKIDRSGHKVAQAEKFPLNLNVSNSGTGTIRKAAYHPSQNSRAKVNQGAFRTVSVRKNLKAKKKSPYHWNVVFYLKDKKRMQKMYHYLHNFKIKDKFMSQNDEMGIYAVFVGSMYDSIDQAVARRAYIERQTGVIPKIVRRRNKG